MKKTRSIRTSHTKITQCCFALLHDKNSPSRSAHSSHTRILKNTHILKPKKKAEQNDEPRTGDSFSKITNMSLKESKGSSSSKELLKLNSKELKFRPDLVAVDGVLYDLHNIAKSHPGGSIVLASGGKLFVLLVQTEVLHQTHDFVQQALYCVYDSLTLCRSEIL